MSIINWKNWCFSTNISKGLLNKTLPTVEHTVCYCPTWKDCFILIFAERFTIRGDSRT